MTNDSKEKLLMAYRAAAAGKNTSIADLLEDVILDVMGGGKSPVTRGNRNTLEPPWNVTCGPALSTTTECTGIDHTTREVTS